MKKEGRLYLLLFLLSSVSVSPAFSQGENTALSHEHLESWLSSIEENTPQKFHSALPMTVFSWNAFQLAFKDLNLTIVTNASSQTTADVRLQSVRPDCSGKDRLWFPEGTKLVSACPGARVLDCKHQLVQRFQNMPFMPRTFNAVKQRKDWEDYIQKNRSAKHWLIKSQSHGGTFLGSTKDVFTELKKLAGEKALNEEFIISQLLQNPWLYEDKYATSMRVYVTVTSYNPLRLYVAHMVSFLVSPAPYDPSNPCAVLSNLKIQHPSYKRCRALRKENLKKKAVQVLHWIPTDIKAFPVEDGSKSGLRMVQMPDSLWHNVLRLIRTVFLHSAEDSDILNRQMLPPGVACSGIWGLDIFVHRDFSVSLLEANSLATLADVSPSHHVMATQFLWFLGGRTGNRTAYLEAFKDTARNYCRHLHCELTFVQHLLDLADERWGFGVDAWKPVFPLSWMDPKLDYRSQAAFGQQTAEFLRQMGVQDDHDFSNPTKFRPPLETMAFIDEILFGIGTEDAVQTHTPVVRSIIEDIEKSIEAGTWRRGGELHAITIAASGDQTLTWFPVLQREVAKLPSITQVTVTAVDSNLHQVELALLKYQGLQLLSQNELLTLVYDVDFSTDDKVQRRDLLDRLLSSHPMLAQSEYWKLDRVFGRIVDRGLLALDKPRQRHIRQFDALRQHHRSCNSSSTPKSDLKKLNDAQLMQWLAHQTFDFQLCFQDMVSNLSQTQVQNPSGHVFPRELNFRWTAFCRDHPQTWQCIAHMKQSLNEVVVPPWMAMPLLPNSKAKIHFTDKHILDALKEAEDESLFFVDMSNVILWVDPKEAFALLAKKLIPEGVALVFVGAVRGGSCTPTGGDMEACQQYLLEVAKMNDLHVHPRWESSLAQLKGHSWLTYFVLPLRRIPLLMQP